MRLWHVLAALGALCGVLGYRLIVLEGRVDGLSRKMARQVSVPLDLDQDDSATALADYEDRLSLLEDDLNAIQENLGDLSAKAVETQDGLEEAREAVQDERIVSLVQKEQQRVLEKQLDYHRERWDEIRGNAVDDLARNLSLTEGQTAQLHGLLRRELDQMLGIFKSPSALEDPQSTASDIQELLGQTNRMANRLLNREQLVGWKQYRDFERATFMPWLPRE